MNASMELDEAALLLRCRQGDTQAFGKIVKKYMQRAYFTALGLVGSHEEALDLSQEAFVRAFRHCGRIDPAQKFFTWYYRILKNLCLNFQRDRARRAQPFSHSAEQQLHEIPDPAADASVIVETDETKRLVWQAILALPEHSREIIVLKEFQNLSYEELAELLDCPIGTVMSRLFHARRALKTKLERWHDA